MAGHSKWANIKHRKAAQDKKRGKMWTKLIREVTIAAREGGGDPGTNPRLRLAMDKARGVNMPKDNVKRAIAKGTGESGGANYEQIFYEGYGPGGVAVYIEVLTDNKNRIVSEIRHAFSKCNGNMGESGCVAWMFESKGFFLIKAEGVDEEALMEAAIEAGAEDVSEAGDMWEITCDRDMGRIKYWWALGIFTSKSGLRWRLDHWKI